VKLLKKKTAPKLHSFYDDLSELLNKEWIKRLWKYQEILLASDPVIVCGHSHLPWPELALGIMFLEYSGINYRNYGPLIES